jgi:X-Pro dipeptidyl-peptidase (S15 family)
MSSIVNYFVLSGIVFRVLFSVDSLVWINLLIILICRGLYSYCFYLNYIKHPAPVKEGEEAKFTFNKRRKIEFCLKQIAVLMLCLFSFNFAILFGLYSMFLASSYVRQIGIRKEDNKQRVTIIILTFVWNTTAILVFILMVLGINPVSPIDLPIDLGVPIGITVALVFGAIGSILYVFPGKLFVRVKLSFYNRQMLGKLSQKARRIILLIMMCIPSLYFIGMLSFGIPIKDSYMLEMDDGTKLATDVHFSTLVGRKPAPVVFVRSPYGVRESAPEYYTGKYGSMGFHVVLQDSRGTFKSEGGRENMLFIHDTEDGNKTIDWIMKQSWCNGKIASEGDSAHAIAAY